MATEKLPLANLEAVIGYTFTNKNLLRQALTHASYANEVNAKGGNCICNERLEFFGDSVLSLVAGSYLYRTFTELPEGKLSPLRSDLVRTESLCEYAKTFSLGDYVSLGHGLEMGGGRQKEKILEDAFEALLAAIYLDGGLAAATAFAEPFVAANAVKLLNGTMDCKTRLQEFVQRRPGDLLEYILVAESGPDHQKQFTIEAQINGQAYGTGTASSKRAAEQAAAKEALSWFEQPPQTSK